MGSMSMVNGKLLGEAENKQKQKPDASFRTSKYIVDFFMS